jgi:hypothetical protein
MSTTVALIIIAGIIGILLYLLIRTGQQRGGAKPGRKKAAGAPAAEKRKLKDCPVCSTGLGPGERVHSVVYPGEGDRIMEIHGCPYCYPATPHYRRICPVCRQVLAPDDHLIARMFEKPGKKHVHVLGCGKCYKNPRR